MLDSLTAHFRPATHDYQTREMIQNLIKSTLASLTTSGSISVRRSLVSAKLVLSTFLTPLVVHRHDAALAQALLSRRPPNTLHRGRRGAPRAPARRFLARRAVLAGRALLRSGRRKVRAHPSNVCHPARRRCGGQGGAALMLCCRQAGEHRECARAGEGARGGVPDGCESPSDKWTGCARSRC